MARIDDTENLAVMVDLSRQKGAEGSLRERMKVASLTAAVGLARAYTWLGSIPQPRRMPTSSAALVLLRKRAPARPFTRRSQSAHDV